ncbi:RING-H2 finger protein ATL80 [Tupanvirus soda lake]|uniref:RING-H2 finger protein ATL80 n=2 Tax=Tupanvirus TaxID=2094720 RepID=A0A6N1NM61_9VIRU|nr:RING-H2 finger protein ATL80 [Tupanvirus soda lake]QKU35559.1 RING-H2 finger protein ATL80 [Tupanvirus soda lake]
MIEISILLLQGIFHSYSSDIAMNFIVWRKIHNQYINQYMDIDKNQSFYHVIIIVAIFRIWILKTTSIFYNEGYLLLPFINALGIIFGIRWIYNIFIIKTGFDATAGLFFTNIFEFIINSYMTQSENYFISSFCMCYVSLFGLTILSLLNWCRYANNRIYANRFERTRTLQKSIHKELHYTEVSFKTQPQNNAVCYLCHEDYDGDTNYYLMQCGHHGHTHCLDKWWNHCGYKKCMFTFCE